MNFKSQITSKKIIVAFLFAILLAQVPGIGFTVQSSYANHQILGWDTVLSPFTVFGPNQLIVIDTGQYHIITGFLFNTRGDCTEPNGIGDFLGSSTDVYIVPSGTVGGGSNLLGLSVGAFNTVVGTPSGFFLGALIGATAPTGNIPAGSYAVVYDECQDGTFNASEDALF